MKALVVYCHPCEESFNASVRDTVLHTLSSAGHETRVTDLYADGFDPIMSADDRRLYHVKKENCIKVQEHVDNIQWCNMIVFVYPTWWYGPPAMLKGWLERVWLPHAAFYVPTAELGLRPKMQHVEKLCVVTTCGATWWLSKLIGEPGRKMLLRGVRSLCAVNCKTLYLALYKMDSSTPQNRAAYLTAVAKRLRRF